MRATSTPRAARKPVRLSNRSSAAARSSPASAASARSSAAASSGSPRDGEEFLDQRARLARQRGRWRRAPPARGSARRSRRRVRPPTVLMPAIDSRSVTSACAAFGSEPASAASTPWYSGLLVRRTEREHVEVVRERGLAVEVLHQAALPGRREIERRDQRGEQPDVAHADFRRGDAVMRGGLEAEREHLGVGRGLVAARPNDSMPACTNLGRHRAAVAEHRAEIAEALRPRRRRARRDSRTTPGW